MTKTEASKEISQKQADLSPLIVCITGAPRTGTHLLNSLLCASARVPPMMGEALPVIDMLATWKRASGHYQSHGDSLGVSQPQLADLYAEWLKGLAARMAERFAADIAVFRGPLLAQHIAELLSLLQRCGLPYRVISMVRWPPDAVASLAVWSAKLKASGKGGPIVEDSSPAALARFWRQYYVDLLRLASDQPLDRMGIRVVRYEDLVGAPEVAAGALGSFIGLDLASLDTNLGWQNSLVPYTEALGEFVTPLYGRAVSSRSIGEGRRTFSESEIADILQICRDIVERYYPEEVEATSKQQSPSQVP